ASRARVACKADATGDVALVSQNLGKRGDIRAEAALVTQRHDARAEAVPAGEHRGVGAGRRYVRAVVALEQRAGLREPVDVRRGLMVVSVAAHMVREQAVHGKQDDIRALLNGWF